MTTVSSIAGVELSTLGVAYLFLLGNLAATVVCFAAARAFLVISPNPAARDYGLYVSLVLVMLLVATTLENEYLPAPLTPLSYAAVPHLLLLLVVHLSIYHRQEPWLVALGVSALAGALPMVFVAGRMVNGLGAGHWIALGLFCSLLGFVWLRAISTRHGFVKARSIYVGSKERPRAAAARQTPWLGLPQWVGLICASIALATLNALLGGGAIDQVPAVQVLIQATLLLGVTAVVCSIPAIMYWLTRKTWMPELTRVVWLVWLVVGFTFTYGNFLISLERA